MYNDGSSQRRRWQAVALVLIVALPMLPACKSPRGYRQEANEVAYGIIAAKQQAALGEVQPFTVRPPADGLRERLLLKQDLPYSFHGSKGTRHIAPIPQLPDGGYLEEQGEAPSPPWLDRADNRPMVISLEEALMIGARNSREFQTRKERLFLEALDLDLEREDFRMSWAGLLQSGATADLSGEETVAGLEHNGEISLRKRFTNGMLMTAQLGVDMVKLLTGGETSSLGIYGDASISIPLLRGSSEFVVTEPLTQAERDVIYAIYDLESFKADYVINVASAYFSVLEQADRVDNAERNYRGLILSVRRSRRLADEGRLSEIQVDQAIQNELRARERWVNARETLDRRLDALRRVLGLPPDAAIIPGRDALDRLRGVGEALIEEVQQEANQPAAVGSLPYDAPVELVAPLRTGGGQFELDPLEAMLIAFDHRKDLRIAIGRVFDAQRKIVVAADDLRADLTLLGQMSLGEGRSLGASGRDDADFRLSDGRFSGLVTLDLPLDRVAERNRYRASWIALEAAVRDGQELEDGIKLDVRESLRSLVEARETIRIQARAVAVARRRVRSTQLFLEQGRPGTQIRDVLDAQDALIAAENALTSALVRYRLTELELQRDLGVLVVDSDGLWREYSPEGAEQ